MRTAVLMTRRVAMMLGKEAAMVFLGPVLSVILLLGSAAGAAQPGDLLVPEVLAGSVVNIRGGGDFTGAPRFATGLGSPRSICTGPGGDVYVSLGSRVVIVTQGGDFTGAPDFATDLPGDGRLFCNDTEILWGSNATGEVLDVTAGGSFSGATPFAEGLALLAGLFRDSGGTLWASNASGDIFDITAGGDFSAATPFASGTDAAEMAERAGMLLVASGFEIIDFTAGGDLSLAPVFAMVVNPRGLLNVPGLGLFAAAGNGSGVFEISAGGDFLGTQPFASGVATTFGLASLAYVAGCGDGIVQDPEECDDGNTVAGDGCDAMCMSEVPEPAHALLLVTGALVLLGARCLRLARARTHR